MSKLLTVTESATQLATDAFHINRLIALGELKATHIGAGGPLRIIDTELAGYVSRGAPSFDHPELQGDWFSQIDRNIKLQHEAFVGAIADELKRVADPLPEPAVNVTTVAITPTATMKQLAAAKVPPLLATIKSKKAPPAPFANRLDNSLVWTVRQNAHSIARRVDKVRKPLATLYRDRETFLQITEEAMAAALNSTVNYRRAWPGKIGAFSQPHQVSFNVRLGDLIATNPQRRGDVILAMAF